jgi:hypothetical protein
MIIADLNVIEPVFAAAKADPVLQVDADAVLSVSVSLQFFQMIRWRDPQIVESLCMIDHDQFA